MKPVLTFFPETRLAKLAARFGGIARDDAIEKAKESIESLRGEADEAIQQGMGQIESVLASSTNNRLPVKKLKVILRVADQIVTLAGTFDYVHFERVMKSLCDVADGLIEAGLEDAAPIAVHARAMRLLAPGTTSLSLEQTETMLAELGKILTHYEFSPIAGQASDQVAIGVN